MSKYNISPVRSKQDVMEEKTSTVSYNRQMVKFKHTNNKLVIIKLSSVRSTRNRVLVVIDTTQHYLLEQKSNGEL